MKIIRIGSGAGYGGDRIEPAIDLMERGNLDYIIFECLAERTIALAQLEKLSQPERGYNPLFEYRMEKILAALKKHPVRVITNMGAANPLSAARKARRMADQAGLSHLRIAAVTGDDVYPRLPEFWEQNTLETGEPLKNLQADLISANAYMGCAGIVQALEQGADIVITGRVADPALVLGPLVFEFGWSMDDWDKLGKGTLAGHLLECAGQVTGGYYCDPGIRDVPELWNLGFPLAEVGEDGSLTITKLPGTGGLVSEDTCKQQLIYELQDPARYYTPDCTADFQHVSMRQDGPDRVRISGATGHPHNGKLKVSAGYQDCWIGEGQISYGGHNALARARLAGEVVRRRLELTHCQLEELRIDHMGIDSLYGPALSQGAPVPVEVRLRVAGRTRCREEAEKVANEVEALYTNGPAGGGGAVKSVRRIVSVASILIPRDTVTPQITFC